MFLNQVSGIANDLRVENRFSLRVIKRGNRDAPGALPRDTPVGPGLHGALDAVDAPLGNPVHAVNFGKRLLAEFVVVNLDEPLIHRAEDDGCFAAPTMRIAVVIILLVQ
jgi:hypothetical protein